MASLEKRPLQTCCPASLPLQNLEKSRARLLQPINTSASWLTSLKPLSTQGRPDYSVVPYAPGIQGGRPAGSIPEKAQTAPCLVAEAKTLQTCPAFPEPSPLWLEKPLLKQATSCTLTLRGLEDSRARLLKPIVPSAPQLAPSKALVPRPPFQRDHQETLCGQMPAGLPASPRAQNDSHEPCSELERPPPRRQEEDEMDSAGTMPEYILTMPEDDPMEVQQEERDPLRDESPAESIEQNVEKNKLQLLNLVCCSLVEGPKFGKPPSALQEALVQTCKSLAEHDPEFILKVALYTRQELNIRSAANFLLALAAFLPPGRPHLRRYFCHATQLPSDWMEVARLYQSLAGEGEALAPMPSCLRAAMTDKFRQFSPYQLAKYNTRKSQGKKRPRPKTSEQKPDNPRWNAWKQTNLGQDDCVLEKVEALEKIYRPKLDPSGARPAAPKDRFSLKALIQRLHISEPAQHVMSLLGQRYPSDLRTFSRSRLPGLWDPKLAGTRMKLPKPVTWDRELSQRGNKTAVWEELIDRGQLPFMAMLRNLRNILRSGVSERHHRRLLERLENKESVIRSRQLPFRFLAAYKSILDLEKNMNEKGTPLPSNAHIIEKILGRLNPPRRIRAAWFGKVGCRRLLEVPIIFRLVKIEKKKLLKAREVQCSRSALQRYRQALETAIGFAVRHNVPPIPGRTLILVAFDDMYRPYVQTRDLCCPSTNEEGRTEWSSGLLKSDVAMLLGCMVYSACEQAEFFLCDKHNWMWPVSLTGSVLQDVQYLKDKNPGSHTCDQECVSDIIMDFVVRRQHVDTILLLSNEPLEKLRGSCVSLYRHRVSPNCLFVNVCASVTQQRTFASRKDVVLSGFNEQVLRFMAERGSSHFLEHVEKIDEIYGVPRQQGAVMAKPETGAVTLTPAPQNRWRSVRVFVSSTFRDMHGERDLLIRSVFPELRSRAAQFCLAVEDIDLRWGITEHESRSNKELELCLSEVTKSQIFIGILSERYGHIPKDYGLPEEPQYEWVKSYPAGRSITEMESVQFLEGSGEPTAGSRAFFYFREPQFLSSIPDTWRADFLAESEEAKRRMVDLKERLSQHEGLASLGRYTCTWGGVAQGRPYVKGLEDFGNKVLEDVWKCLRHHFIEAAAEKSKVGGSVPTDDSEDQEEKALQESFQELQHRRFCARAKLLRVTAAQLQGGRLYVVNGEPGQGKTVFLAALAQELRTKTPPHGGDPSAGVHVLAHFTRARPDQAQAQVVLGHLCALLRNLVQQPPPLPRSYRGLVSQFKSLLYAVAQTLKRQQFLVVLIDGADSIHGPSGQLVSDWMPEQLPQRVSLVLSVSAESELLGSLRRRADAVAIPLGPLDPPDRVVLVRKDLALYGKKLEESPFNNQMRLVLLKRGSRQPLYLTLLTQDLRLFALYEQLSERIQKLPISLPLLLQHLLGCLEQDYGLELVAVAFMVLWASRDGLMERDLHAILATWKELRGAGITLEEAMVAGCCPGSYPMASFLDFLRSLKGLLLACGSPLEAPGSRLHLCGTPLRTAVERRYRKKPGLERTAHVLLAAHWWKQSDAWAFQHCEAEALRELPYHLVHSGQFSMLASFLTNLKVLSTHVRLGLLHCLSEAYTLYEAAAGLEHDEAVAISHAFLQRNIGLLSQNPQLLLQQAANEPDSSDLCSQARAALCGSGIRFLKWINKPQTVQKAKSLVLPLPATPSCISVAPSGKLASVGTAEGTLHLLDAETGQELKSLLSGCDGISTCAFLSETTVCLGAFTGHLEVWSLKEGCRLMGKEAHKAQITDCSILLNRRLLATVSLDGLLKFWESASGALTRERDCLCPLNCVTFHHKRPLVAFGGWDKTVTILDVDDMRVISVLRDHSSAVRSISFNSAGNVLAAGSLTGSVSLWSWQDAVVLGTFSAHSGCVSTALFLPGGKLLTTGEDCKVQLWVGHLGQLQSTLGSKAPSPATCAVPSLDGSRLAVGRHPDDVRIYSHPWEGFGQKQCQAGGVAVRSLAWLDNIFLIGGRNDGSLCVWDTSQHRPPCLREVPGHEGAVTGLAVSQRLVASVSEDFTVRLWLPQTLRPGPALSASDEPLAVLRGHKAGLLCCAFSLDGCHLATGGKDKDLLLWDVRNPSQNAPSLMRSLRYCHRDWIADCAWAGPLVLSASNDATVCLWDPSTGQRLQEFLGHQRPVCSVIVAKAHVIAMARDGMLAMWDLQGIEKTRFLAHPGGATYCAGFQDPRQKEFLLAVCGGDGTVKLWMPLMMEQPQVLPGHCGAVRGAAALPTSFLTVSEDKTVRVWPLPKEEAEGDTEYLPPHGGAVTALAWSPDGEFAASGGKYGDLLLWNKARAKVGSHCINALVFTSPRTILVASDVLSFWEIKHGGPLGAPVSLAHKKALRLPEDMLVVCMGASRPPATVLLGLEKGDLLVLKPGAEDFQTTENSYQHWSTWSNASFNITASDEEEGSFFVWDSMDQPSLFKMMVTKSGKLDESQETTEDIGWLPNKHFSQVTVARVVKGKSLFCADSEGFLWTQSKPDEEGSHWCEPDAWQSRKLHSGRITAMHILGDRIVTASHDQDVKIWDGNTMKLLGQFRCRAPVSCLEPRPSSDSSLLLAVGDTLGHVYFLEWDHLAS
ncbi:telomerase protein component 1 isoform X3 [Varanus komodoensis]|uniref:telomerase protein component 1 isoform X3 n=1 Tax=Varanus komodoensis TaxID=61221 RepID=UPI001CF768F5|nr:telomerase protein component 1 isoform X3 [Varanus komodoensis]